MIQTMLRKITQNFHLNAITLGEFHRFKVNGTNYELWAFHAEGLGHVSAIHASGFLGMTKTNTLIINPMEKDLPLFYCDRVQSRGNDSLSCTLYDTFLEGADLSAVESVKEKFTALPNQDPDKHWSDDIKLAQSLSKKGRKDQSAALDDCAMAYLEAFLSSADAAPYCDPDGKREKASVYVDGLLEHGGPGTDALVKGLGKERTDLLFRRFLFNII